MKLELKLYYDAIELAQIDTLVLIIIVAAIALISEIIKVVH